MNIDTQSLYSQLGLTQASSGDKKKEELGQGDFLRLMTEQLKNQDPLKPLESTAFLGQLAQFSQVQGLQQLNASFAGLASSVESDRALQGAALVGHNVLVGSNSFANEGYGVRGAVETPQAGTVNVEIRNAAGAVIHRVAVAADSAGTVTFDWDGRLADGETAPAGSYSISANVSTGSQAQALSPQLVARVDSVTLDPSGLILNLSGVGATPLSAIRRIG